MIRYLFSIIVAFTALNALADDTASIPVLTTTNNLHFFEMRSYHAAPGKFDSLRVRFRDLTDKLFIKHGMSIVGTWVPVTENGAGDTLIYIIGFPSRAAHDKAWKDFSDDIEWLAIKTDSEQRGKLIAKVDIVYMTAAFPSTDLTR